MSDFSRLAIIHTSFKNVASEVEEWRAVGREHEAEGGLGQTGFRMFQGQEASGQGEAEGAAQWGRLILDDIMSKE